VLYRNCTVCLLFLQLASTVENLDDIGPVLPHLSAFFEFLDGLLADKHDDVAHTALTIVASFISKIGLAVKPVLPIFIPTVIEVCCKPGGCSF
jgi:hypothetical protein